MLPKWFTIMKILSKINTIKKKCRTLGIEAYTINDDYSIDVEGDVNIANGLLTKLPIVFNRVSGNFNISGNFLTTLKNSPSYVGGYFDCGFNSLDTLEFCPEYINGGFICQYNNLTSLQYGPSHLNGIIGINNNYINTLLHFPKLEDDSRCILHKNDLPATVNVNLFNENMNVEYYNTFLKYQEYYEVWIPKFTVESFFGLFNDIKDGLR